MWTTLELVEGAKSYEAVARAIEAKILSEGMQPGEILPSETRFATMLGVNRSTLREALRALEQNGLVYREPGRRKLRVSRPRVEDMSPRLVSAMVAQNVTYEDLFEAMCALEPAIAGAAAKRASPELVAALEDNLSRTRQAMDDRESLTQLDIEFHALVARAADNPALEAARQPLGHLFYPAFYPVMSRLNAAERLLIAHDHVVSAIKRKDSATSIDWMSRHIHDFQRGYSLANLDMDAPVTPEA